MPDSRFFADLPSNHRTDWGEALAVALGIQLARLNPDHVSTSARTKRGGVLNLQINGPDRERIEIDCWEDEACVRHRDAERHFKLPTGRVEPTDNWIPSAVEHVMGIVRSWLPVR